MTPEIRMAALRIRRFLKRSALRSFETVFRTVLICVLGLVLLAGSSPAPGDPQEKVRYYTRPIEFDFVGWTLQALSVKLEQSVLGAGSYIPVDARPEILLSYLSLIRQIQILKSQVHLIFADPQIQDPEKASEALRFQLAALQKKRDVIEPIAESILQSQVAEAAVESGLALGGQALPPVLYRTTSPPFALIISPREVIRQDFNISISPQLSIEEQVNLESRVERAFNVSSLVVGIGGIGVYPTMVMETTDINWLTEVVAHEWIHNYLTLRPLGINYLASPELRTMNETVASIAGKELARLVVSRHYPEFLPPPEPAPLTTGEEETSQSGEFNFRVEMRKTRVWVDRLLSEGRVEEAETYMEARRRFFWENGYQIRKLNQAYFAFYGAYADDPQGGAAGEDPVGAAVRLFRQQSPSLGVFVRRISWMSSVEQLEAAIAEGP